MNGPVKMYLTKPIIHYDLPVELPNCMYNMKNIHAIRNGTVITDTGHVSTTKENLDTFDQKNQTMPQMAALIARQEQILQQLADLKKQMLSLKENLKISVPNEGISSLKSTFNIKFDCNDVVINVNPLHPPYFLVILQRLWSDCVHFCFQSYLHSTIIEIPEEAKILVNKLQTFKPKCNLLPQLMVRIIWKEIGPHAELVVSRVPILGEVNILRYLARETSSLDYETSNPFELDFVLDTCYALIQAKTKTDRNAAMHVLNKKLGKSQWLCGRSHFTIADIAAYSSLKQIPQSEINVNLSKFVQKCESTFC